MHVCSICTHTEGELGQVRVHANWFSSGPLYPPPAFSPLAFVSLPQCDTVLVMAGSPQDVARQVIGHELSLIGVPPPTTLDGFRPANADEIKNFMISVGLSPEHGEDIASKLKSSLGITSIVQFEWLFSEYPLKDWFQSHAEWRTNAPLFVGMQWAFKTCSKISHAKERNQEQLKDDDKIPMDPILNRSLNETW